MTGVALSRLVCGAGAAALLAGCGALPLSWSKGQDDTQPPIGVSGATQSTAIATHHKRHSKIFKYTGSEQAFEVPSGVTWITVIASGAAGGGASGGKGGRVHAMIPVTAGEKLTVFGGQGLDRKGGFNGGGHGGAKHKSDAYGGGGASDLREADADIRSPILVVGGGGGEGASSSEGDAKRLSYYGGSGGNGGGSVGGAGEAGAPGSGRGGDGGGGGTQTAGGAGGSGGEGSDGFGVSGTSGLLGHGGAGGAGCTFPNGARCNSGGGGGGGYQGGGGGGASAADYGFGGGGGGGGSTYIESNAKNVHSWQGWKDANGNGVVVISW